MMVIQDVNRPVIGKIFSLIDKVTFFIFLKEFFYRFNHLRSECGTIFNLNPYFMRVIINNEINFYSSLLFIKIMSSLLPGFSLSVKILCRLDTRSLNEGSSLVGDLAIKSLLDYHDPLCSGLAQR
jgi:hypothetical protein